MSGSILKNTIKVQRAKQNLIQQQLAAPVCVTRKTINTVVKGKYVQSTVPALKMAMVLNVRVEELFVPEDEIRTGDEGTTEENDTD